MLKLVRFCEEDFSLFAKLVFNEDVMNMNLGRIFSEEEADSFFKAVICANEDSASITGWFKVMLSETNEYIGMFGLTNCNDGEVEIEYMILPQHWGKGYATHLVKMGLETIKCTFVDKKAIVTAITDPDNSRSIRVLEKNGFRWLKTFVNEDGEKVSIYEH